MGNIVKITMKNGNVVEFDYDGNKILSKWIENFNNESEVEEISIKYKDYIDRDGIVVEELKTITLNKECVKTISIEEVVNCHWN